MTLEDYNYTERASHSDFGKLGLASRAIPRADSCDCVIGRSIVFGDLEYGRGVPCAEFIWCEVRAQRVLISDWSVAAR